MLQTARSTSALLFLAAFGDKTQPAVVALAIRTRSPLGVLIGAGSAPLVSALLAVLRGCNLPRLLPESATPVAHYVAGGLFVFVGAWMTWKA